MEQYFSANRELWNARTKAHRDSAFYNRSGFLSGNDVLTPIELAELGDVSGKSLLHLQCHFGMDTLNWARKGAQVTGLDLSDEAIREAQELATEMKVDARFVCSNVYDAPEVINEQFDIVFTTYGVVGWLPDLDKWASVIAQLLKPGGIFYLAEFHPVIWMFDEEFTHIKYAYNNQGLIVTQSEGTYGDTTANINLSEYSWNHSISDVLNALLSHHLALEFFNEHMYSPYPCFNKLVSVGENKWQVEGMEGKIPMVYSLRARKII